MDDDETVEKRSLKRSTITSVISDICGVACSICFSFPLFTLFIVLSGIFYNSCPPLATWNIVMFSLYLFGTFLVINQKFIQLLCTGSTAFVDEDSCRELGLCCSKTGKVIYHVCFTICSYLILVSWDLYGIYLLMTNGNCAGSSTGESLFLYILSLTTIVIDIISNTCSCLATAYVVFDCTFVSYLFLVNYDK